MISRAVQLWVRHDSMASVSHSAPFRQGMMIETSGGIVNPRITAGRDQAARPGSCCKKVPECLDALLGQADGRFRVPVERAELGPPSAAQRKQCVRRI